MARDIVLVTVDCWRYDAPERMPTLRALAEGYVETTALCQAPATRGAFPALLSGLYYPQAYAGFDAVRPEVRPLPQVLSEHGYATGAVCGSNPFLSAWGSYFDYFWNDRMDATADSALAERAHAALSSLRNASSYLRLRSRVTATDVARRARRWYRSVDGPRFLWMHLMDVHVPFFPGLRRGLDEGLVDAYRSHLRFMRDPGSLSPDERQTLQNLYWRSVERLDEQLPRVLGVADDDAHVLVVGDHGEEFDHDKYGHARLYEECVRVPLFVNPKLADAAGDLPDPMRQLDVPATLLDAVGLPVPDEWEGAPARAAERWPAYLLNHSPQFGRTYAGVRTNRYKLIRTFDEDTDRLLRTEAYDLLADPDERDDVHGDPGHVRLPDLEERLDAFLEREDIRGGLREHPTERAPAAVEDRLKALGYK